MKIVKIFLLKYAPGLANRLRRLKLFSSKNHRLYVKYKEFYEAISISGLFEPSYYLAQYPDVAEQDIDPLLHYLHFGVKEGRNPTSYFVTEQYLEQNSDVRSAEINPFYHWVVSGRYENRLPQLPGCGGQNNVNLDQRGYLGGGDYQNTKVRLQNNLPKEYSKDPGLLSFTKRLDGMTAQSAASKIHFSELSKNQNPKISVIIPCLNQGVYTLECLYSLSTNVSKDCLFEVIVVDNNSEDPSYEVIRNIKGVKYIRNASNEGYGEACNIGANAATGQYFLFLNNDAQVAPMCLENMAELLDSQPERYGIVGPKVMSFDGSLQEAGCSITTNGSGRLIGFGQDHREARFNYSREVDYVSGVALMISKVDFEKLGGFDPVYAPAYCEDADLCLGIRSKGKTVVYVPSAMVAHHLSITSDSISNEFKQDLALRNKQKLVEKWQDELLEQSIRLVAFYLPQYHPIPENDRWWGKGFTEWRNVAKAVPNYKGHRQPRMPSDLGYYDLRLTETMEAQAALAKRYGVAGFCYYYYWFDGKRLLDTPLERMLETGRPDFPFCLCWANENWTRTWDGQESDVLISQNYSEANDLEVIKDLVRYFKSPNYITVNERPLLLVYRVKEFPNFNRTADAWRNYCRTEGIGEIYIAMVESFELSPSPEEPKKYGCDITVEFPPHGMVHDQPKPIVEAREQYKGQVNDYVNLALSYMERDEPGFLRLRSVLVGWDNTPRRQDASLVLEGATPGAFQAWLEWTIQRTKEQNYGDNRIVFINAWNEWCEGSYLEPDMDYGHAYLQAVKNALESVYK